MGINDEPTTEPLVKKPQSIREFYDNFFAGIGRGENPIFLQAPTGAVFKNTVGEDKPLLYVYEADGSIKEWLTEAEIKVIQESGDQFQLREEQLFDMFSFMVGGRKPTLQDLGVAKWTDLISQNDDVDNQTDALDKTRKVFEFLDTDPNTSLTSVLGDALGLSTYKVQRYWVKDGDKKSVVILMGETSVNRDKMFVWHPIRNARSAVQSYSPFKADGGQRLGNINDVQIVYQGTEGPRIVRLNKIVFFLARHGLGEQTEPETERDQIYMPPREFAEQVYIQDDGMREKQQQLENENFVINYKLPGFQNLVELKKKSIIAEMFKMANEGVLDGVLRSIAEYNS